MQVVDARVRRTFSTETTSAWGRSKQRNRHSRLLGFQSRMHTAHRTLNSGSSGQGSMPLSSTSSTGSEKAWPIFAIQRAKGRGEFSLARCSVVAGCGSLSKCARHQLQTRVPALREKRVCVVCLRAAALHKFATTSQIGNN